jgi:segregation and condensation protein B
MNHLQNALECILFANGEPVNCQELAKVLQVAPTLIQKEMDALISHYETRGINIRKVNGGFQFCTNKNYYDSATKLIQGDKRVRLSAACLETLSIIAYQQPVTRAEIEAVRGVRAESALHTLLERGVICIRGRKNAPGKPMIYGTTDQFLIHFGLNEIQELPNYETIRKERLK